jgi:tetratricopeptide (TPR) repeat protein
MFNEGGIKKRLLHLSPFALTLLIIPLTLAGGTGKGEGDAVGNVVDSVLAMTSGMEDGVSPGTYLLTEVRVLSTYLRLFFLPVNQNLDYDYPVYSSLFEPPVLLSAVFISLVFGLGIYLFFRSRNGRRRLRFVSFGILWFFVTLSVESSVIPIADVMFEHRMYLPSAGVIAAVSTSMAILADAYGLRGARKAFVPVFAGVIVIFSIMTFSRNSIWQDSRDGIMLWEDVVSKSPGKTRPHLALSKAYYEEGMFNDAKRELRRAMEIGPDYAQNHGMKGVQPILDRYEDAIRNYREVLRSNPDSAEAHNNLGVVYETLGRYEDAEKEYQAALKIEPEYARAHNNLGVVYDKYGHHEDAVKEYQAALRIDPDYAKAHNNLGVVYRRLGRYEDAVRELKAALRINPEYAKAHKNLGAAYEKLGRYEDAVKEYRTALNIQPDNAEIRDKLERAYEMVKGGKP